VIDTVHDESHCHYERIYSWVEPNKQNVVKHDLLLDAIALFDNGCAFSEVGCFPTH
jgi:hypothetical protein